MRRERRVKIVATLGPASNNEETMRRLFEAGADVFRVNMSHSTHDGLRDIHAQLGTGDYWRLRLGIGHPGVKAEVANYVLRKPQAEHREAIEACIDRSLPALDALLSGEMERATLLLHTSKPPRPKPPRPADLPPPG